MEPRVRVTLHGSTIMHTLPEGKKEGCVRAFFVPPCRACQQLGLHVLLFVDPSSFLLAPQKANRRHRPQCTIDHVHPTLWHSSFHSCPHDRHVYMCSSSPSMRNGLTITTYSSGPTPAFFPSYQPASLVPFDRDTRGLRKQKEGAWQVLPFPSSHFPPPILSTSSFPAAHFPFGPVHPIRPSLQHIGCLCDFSLSPVAMTIFQLAKTTRPGQQQASPTVTIPDSARTILEAIVNPLVVVSFCKYTVHYDAQGIPSVS